VDAHLANEQLSGLARKSPEPEQVSDALDDHSSGQTMKRRQSEKDKKLADDARLMRAWRNWHAEQLQEALVGLHGDVMGRLMAKLEDLCTARELVGGTEAMDWSTVDANTRLIALHEINAAIMRLRERLGQEPIDDALWGEPLRASQLIKQIITKFPAPAGEPTSGNG